MKDVYIIDSDPSPEFQYKNRGKHTILSKLRDFIDNDEFSDVTFKVEGRDFKAHKMIVSLLSEKFRAMFTSGMAES